MKWDLDKGRPISPQICEQVCLAIVLGEFLPNDKLLSVREIALAAGVNPNTVQKSFDILENKGILYSQRGSGWYVCEDTSMAKEQLSELYREKTRLYFDQMTALGMDVGEIKKYVNDFNDN
ncbi:MAG: GntR family transcriptional regulator [Clostridia bacterium]|nr:GntR family transcriptional regulator [Clostridia bacterium]